MAAAVQTAADCVKELTVSSHRSVISMVAMAVADADPIVGNHRRFRWAVGHRHRWIAMVASPSKSAIGTVDGEPH
jgi:hypothetical protein